MQIQTSHTHFTSLKADKTGKALINYRINQGETPVQDWQKLHDLTIAEKNNPNEILITKKGGDLGLKATITHKATGVQHIIYENELEPKNPIQFIERVIQKEKEINKFLSYNA